MVSREPVGDLDISGEELALQTAVRTYSVRRPRKLTGELADSGALTALDSAWEPDSYRVSEVRYGSQGTLLDQAYWSTYVDAAGVAQIVFSGGVGPYLVSYQAPHAVTSLPAVDTISSDAPLDVEAVCRLAASYILAAAANYYARMSQSTIGADAVNYQNLHQSHGTRAGAERAEFDRHMEARPQSSGGFVNWSTPNSQQRGRIFH